MYYGLVGRQSIFAIRDFSVSFYSSFYLIRVEIKCLLDVFLVSSLSLMQFLSLVHYILTFRHASTKLSSFHDNTVA